MFRTQDLLGQSVQVFFCFFSCIWDEDNSSRDRLLVDSPLSLIWKVWLFLTRYNRLFPSCVSLPVCACPNTGTARNKFKPVGNMSDIPLCGCWWSVFADAVLFCPALTLSPEEMLLFCFFLHITLMHSHQGHRTWTCLWFMSVLEEDEPLKSLRCLSFQRDKKIRVFLLSVLVPNCSIRWTVWKHLHLLLLCSFSL